MATINYALLFSKGHFIHHHLGGCSIIIIIIMFSDKVSKPAHINRKSICILGVWMALLITLKRPAAVLRENYHWNGPKEYRRQIFFVLFCFVFFFPSNFPKGQAIFFGKLYFKCMLWEDIRGDCQIVLGKQLFPLPAPAPAAGSWEEIRSTCYYRSELTGETNRKTD